MWPPSKESCRRQCWGPVSSCRAPTWWWSLLWFPMSPPSPPRVQCCPDAPALQALSRHGPEEPSPTRPTWLPANQLWCWQMVDRKELAQHLFLGTHCHIRGPWVVVENGVDIIVPSYFNPKDFFHCLSFHQPPHLLLWKVLHIKLYVLRNNLFVLPLCKLTHQSWLELLINILSQQEIKTYYSTGLVYFYPWV